MASYTTMGSTRHSDENMDDDNDDKDDTKRKSRNLSEKKRRDQFNMLVAELGNMVTTNTRKMDKSTVLKATISFLKNHNEVAVRSRVHEIQEDWKPSFLSNEEFTHLILEALDGFIMIFSSNGRIYYASESVTSLLGYLPNELSNSTIYEIAYQEDQSLLYNVLLNPGNHDERGKDENQVSFTCHIKRGSLNFNDEIIYERVHFVGYFRTDSDIESLIPSTRYTSNVTNDTKMVFVGTGRLHTPQLIRDVSLIDINKSEFVSKHSLEWKFLFLDQRASPIIGYLPFEVLGTSGYDYYHVDDLDKVVTCHESLMRKGEGTSCFYRFLTKGQQWIWLQTRFYIDYNQWNSKPEFIVCTHNVINYAEVIKQLKKNKNDNVCNNQEANVITTGQLQQPVTPCQSARSSAWSPKSPKTRSVTRSMYRGTKSNTVVSVGSHSSRVSASTTPSNDLKSPVHSTKPIQGQGENRLRRSDVEADCLNYEGARYSGEGIQAPGGFLPPTAPTVALAVPPNTMLVNQQNIVMTTAQNHIQDELQRKHEELQQLIVHQQEELRRVSEQLFIARYGILSPLMNVGVPYTVNTCQSIRCDNNNEGNRLVQSDGVQSVPVTIPVTVSLPIVSADTFPHVSAVIPVAPIVSPTIPQGQQISNSGISFIQQQMQGHHVQRNEQIHHIQQGQVQDAGQMMPFQICQQPEMLYNNLDTSVNGQNSSARN